MNKGLCKPEKASYLCLCQYGYSGVNCQESIYGNFFDAYIFFFFTKSKIKFIFKLFAKKTIARMEAHAIVWMTLIIVHAQKV